MPDLRLPLRRTPPPLMLACTSLALGLFGLGCSVRTGSGVLETESRQIKAAAAIDVCCGFEVQVEHGSSASAKVTTDTELLDNVEIKNEGDRLVIGWESDLVIYQPSSGVKVKLVLPELTSVAASGGSSVLASEISGETSNIDLSGGSSLTVEEGALEVETLVVEASGASHLSLGDATLTTVSLELSGGSSAEIQNLSSEMASFGTSGASKITVAGIGDELDVDASGASQLELIEMATRRAHIDASGGSSVTVDARERLEVNASGGSSVKYRKEPPELVVELSGGSSAGKK